jgi:antirestriction protein ArdC
VSNSPPLFRAGEAAARRSLKTEEHMAKAFDKDSWLAQKEQRLQDATTALEDGLKALQSSDDWRRMLEGMAQVGALSVGRYSFQNQILICQQRPGTRLAATFQTWKEHGRFVRKGEKGICILAPIVKNVAEDDADDETKELRLVGFRLMTVFGVDQTDGDALPEIQLPNITADEVFEGSVETLREIALSIDGNPVSGVELRTRQDGDPSGALGWYKSKTKHIVVVTDSQSRAQQFSTLCHEVAHALLHPMGDPHGAPEREVEAESTAFVVCHALELDTSKASFPYVATWASRGPDQDPLKIIALSGQRIATAATRILNALCGDPNIRSEATAIT